MHCNQRKLGSKLWKGRQRARQEITEEMENGQLFLDSPLEASESFSHMIA